MLLALVVVVLVAAAAIGFLVYRLHMAALRIDETERSLVVGNKRVDEAVQREEAIVAEVARLAVQRVPAISMTLTRPGAPVPGLGDASLAGGEVERAMTRVLDACTTVAVTERQRVDAAARASMRGATSKIQTLLYQIQNLLQQLQAENDDPRLLELDFRNELALRRIQATAVLCEAWPGLARTDSPLAEVVVGAKSRVGGYERVKVANHLRERNLAVVARAAEPLAIALAELLSNATAYSPPPAEVPITLQQGGRGAILLIDDAGIGMDADELERAKRLLAGTEGVLLTELGDPPRAGFAVIGRLAAQYGFTVQVEPSPYGGVRAIVRLPSSLLTVVEEERPVSALVPPPLSVMSQSATPQPAPAEPSPAAQSAEPRVVVPMPAPAPVTQLPTRTQGGGRASLGGDALPSRRRRQPRPAPAAASAEHPPVERSPEQAGARWAALQHGTVTGRDSAAGRDDDGTPSPVEGDA